MQLHCLSLPPLFPLTSQTMGQSTTDGGLKRAVRREGGKEGGEVNPDGELFTGRRANTERTQRWAKRP